MRIHYENVLEDVFEGSQGNECTVQQTPVQPTPKKTIETATSAPTIARPNLNFPTALNGFKLTSEWHSFYNKLYNKKGKKYIPVIVTTDPTKKCGCEGSKCTTNSAKFHRRCEYCSKHMRSNCIHDDGMIGVCRECFLKYSEGRVVVNCQVDDLSQG
jgi:hypothetical protein